MATEDKMDKLKDNLDHLKEKMKELEGLSSNNADVINKFTVDHIKYEEKFDMLEDSALNFGQEVGMLLDRCIINNNNNGVF
jgi:hypothetical protein